MFTEASFAIAKAWKPPKCPLMNGGIKKRWCMHVTEYYSTLKNDEMVPFTMTWTDLESVVLSETRKAEKDENHTMSLIEVIKRKKEPRKSVTFNP